jgi:ribosomal-protein-alanine N-acetyltransferase
MRKIEFRIIDAFDKRLLDILKKLEIDNLGRDAAINEWQLPVIIRYGRMIVAETAGGRIAGVCEVLREWSDDKIAFIHSFYIIREQRKKGIGRRLLAYVLDYLRKENFLAAELTVNPENQAAKNLYSSAGFSEKEIRKNEYGNGNDRLLMKIELV